MTLEILTDLAGYQQDVEDLRQEWVLSTLESIGIERDLIEEMPQSDLFDLFIQYGIEISYYPSFGGSTIKLEDDLIGEWGGPEFEVKFDENNKPYYKITIEYWFNEPEE